MKKGGLLNHRLADVVAQMGHTDGLVVADAGLPVPLLVERIDLAVSPGVPSFLQVIEALAGELQVERFVIATETRASNPHLLAQIERLFPDATAEFVPHATFKELTLKARAIVRTGECSPYANVLLYSGVIF